MLRKKLEGYRIILASGSPRRQQFLLDLDINFEIRLKDVEEIYPDHLTGEEIPDYLAKLKASAFDGELQENDILITSDTIVWHQGEALGKPKDYDDAFAIIKKLSGSTHEVITSVCIKTISSTDVFNEMTKVTFNFLEDDDIKYYLDNFKPYDKAGAYGIQDWIGLVGVARIDGSYANVMGLPVDLVYQYLKNHADGNP